MPSQQGIGLHPSGHPCRHSRYLDQRESILHERSMGLCANVSLLQQDTGLLDQGKVSALADGLQPFEALLQKFHKDYPLSVDDEDSRQLLLQFINAPPQLLQKIESAVETGAALFSVGINFMVARALLTSPSEYSSRINFAPAANPRFKATQNLNDLLPLLHRAPEALPQQQQQGFQNLLQQLLPAHQTAATSAQHNMQLLGTQPPIAATNMNVVVAGTNEEDEPNQAASTLERRKKKKNKRKMQLQEEETEEPRAKKTKKIKKHKKQ